MNSSSSSKWKWKRKASSSSSSFVFIRSPILTISLITFLLLLIIFFISSNNNNYNSQFALPCTRSPPTEGGGGGGEMFLWYPPHSGFSNQLAEFKNAILMASILNRTLIIPPILDHHSLALGSCPKFRVLHPNHLRFSLWNHTVNLLRHRRYISMADIIDVSKLVSHSPLRFIDFRVFISTWCGVNMDTLCSLDTTTETTLRHCGSLLSGYNGNVDNCLYASTHDCTTTVWTYQKDQDEGVLDSFQPDQQLKKKKNISFVRRRRDVYKTLGPGSKAEFARVLAFGSLFTAPYKGSESHIDIHEAPNDQRVQSLIQEIEYLPFVPEITDSAKKFALQTIKTPFVCAQLRLLDGQFKYHWKTTFLGLKQKLESLKQKGKGTLPIAVFVMTDLPEGNWTGTYLGDMAKETDTYKVFVLREGDELVKTTARKIVNAQHGMKKLKQLGGSWSSSKDVTCRPNSLPDILLYMEGSVCSCASLGFVGTAGSTIAESITSMRKHDICSSG